jgi:hypothetical protein
MAEFLHVCFSLINLPFTVLLVLVGGYWLMIFVGVLGLDAFDLDLEADADADVPGPGGDGPSGQAAGGALLGLGRFFHLGEVPIMILLSIFALSSWTISVLGNFALNSSSRLWIAALLLIPNMLVSALVTKLAAMPLGAIFRHMEAGVELPTKIVGTTCIIKTSEATGQFGQAEIVREGAPLLLNVRTRNGARLVKGDEAVIVDHDSARGVYEVVKLDLGT